MPLLIRSLCGPPPSTHTHPPPLFLRAIPAINDSWRFQLMRILQFAVHTLYCCKFRFSLSLSLCLSLSL